MLRSGRRLRLPRFGRAPQQSISTIGIGIAKSVLQVHGVDAAGQVVLRSQLRRRHVQALFPVNDKFDAPGIGIMRINAESASDGSVP